MYRDPRSYVDNLHNISLRTYIGHLVVSLWFSRDYDLSLLNFHWVQFMSLIPPSLISFATLALSVYPFALFILFTTRCTIHTTVIYVRTLLFRHEQATQVNFLNLCLPFRISTLFLFYIITRISNNRHIFLDRRYL